MDVRRFLLAFCLMIAASGCSLTNQKPFWFQPALPGVQNLGTVSVGHGQTPVSTVQEIELALLCDRAGSPDATGHYLHVLEQLWPQMESSVVNNSDDAHLLSTYNRSLARFLICAQRHGQYVPGTGVVLATEGETRTVPVRLIGLTWTPTDLQQLYPVGDYYAKSLTRQVRRCGWGMPLVARRTCGSQTNFGEQFLLPESHFSLTAVLRTEVVTTDRVESPASQPVLEFYNPLNFHELSVAGSARPISADLSAPFAFQEVCRPPQNDSFEWFIHPKMNNQWDRLFFLEPWQPGKIPVVMIHGLLSSPRTWVNLANELRSIPGFSDRYQIWGFRYATGQPFLTSAATLRRDLTTAVAQMKESFSDPALDHVVLIGHSMGGLLAKAQISYSEDQMWCAAANRPLSQIRGDQETCHRLNDAFYFSPQPSVRRVVFVAVPHRGSSLATRLVGQIGSALVQPDAELTAKHDQLIQNNPGVFSRELRRGNPDSIKLLKSDSPLLQTLYRLPVSSEVKMHSIIGNARCSIGDGRGDGIVGIKSARHPGVVSELYVPATHTQIHGRPETVREVWRILCEHHQEYLLGNGLQNESEIPTPLASVEPQSEISLVLQD